MKVFAILLGETPVRLWGLTSRQYLRRVLVHAGVNEFPDDLDAVPERGSVLLLRSDYLYDERVVRKLAGTPEVLLEIRSGKERLPVAAHVPSGLAALARDVLLGEASSEVLTGIRRDVPETLSSPYQEQLLKFDIPYVLPITPENRKDLERRLFTGAYKGVTDLVTKWAWPGPAKWATGLCVRCGLRPNHVTAASLALVLFACVLFLLGKFGLGLLAGWMMTFLDTVDGKLARVTVTYSKLGHLFDHVIDLAHPPLWYVAWGLGLPFFHPGIPGLTLSSALWLIVAGYVAGRFAEGAFLKWLGTFGVFCWRPVDSYFRLITARRNPNLILLSASAAAGRPDLGLLAVAAWTVATSLFLVARLAMGWRAMVRSGPLRSWLQEIDPGVENASLAVRLFTHRSGAQSGGSHG